MATAVLDWNNIVGIDKTVLDSGYTGDLLQIAGAHLQSALDAGRLTQSQVGEIYATMIPSAFQQAIQFELHEKLTEAQIDKAVADASVAEAQVDIAVAEASNAQAKTLAEIEKVYGYDATILNGIITLGADTADGKMDYDRDLVLEKTETEALNNKTDGVVENQILKLKEDVAVAKTQSATELANSIANIDKVLGYDYTLDAEGNIVVGLDTKDGKLDAERDLVETQEYIARLEIGDKLSKSSQNMIDKINTVMTQFDLGDADNRTNV